MNRPSSSRRAYAALIADRTLLLIQAHAQPVAGIPSIRHAQRRGPAGVTRFAGARSGAPHDGVQRFIAYGQLCHLSTAAGVADAHEDWADVLNRGIRHPKLEQRKP